jgi:hypothetical protein
LATGEIFLSYLRNRLRCIPTSREIQVSILITVCAKARKENRMKNCITPEQRITRRILPVACATALATASTVSLPHPAHAGQVIVPSNLPMSLVVYPPNHPFLLGKAQGSQNYICTTRFDAAGNPVLDAAGNPTFAWKLFTPEATLFSNDPRDPKQLITHFFSPNPDEVNADTLTNFHPIRATWQSSRDTSSVWARTVVPGDSVDVTAGAVAWLKLTAVGTQKGPDGGDVLANTTFVQRVNTSGGVAPPADTCDSLQEVGSQAFRPYTADYIFYTDK